MRRVLRTLAWLVHPHPRAEWMREWSAELEQARLEGRSRLRILWWAAQDAAAVGFRRLGRGGLPARELRLAVRGLRRAPGYAAVVVGTLALGIGANTAVFSVVDALLLRPLPIERPNRVVMLAKIKDGRRNATSAPNYLAWRDRTQDSFEELSAAQVWSANVLAGGVPLRVSRTLVTPGFFRALGVAPVLGRAFTDDEGTAGRDDVAILSHDLWVQAFGADAGVLGRSVTVNGEAKTVVGILPEGFRVPPLTARIWMPLAFAPDALEAWGRNNLYVVGRLGEAVSLERARSELDVVGLDLEREHPEANEGWGIDALPLQDAAVGTESRRALWLLFGAAGFVLLIACVNVAGLVIARGVARERELAVRISLGASRPRILAQLLSETVLLALLGGALGGALAWLGLGPVRAMVPPGLTGISDIVMNGQVFTFALGTAVLTGVAAGLVPAVRLSGRAPTVAGGGGIAGLLRTRNGAGRGGGILVAMQFALATVLLVGAGLMVRSLEALYDVDVGVRYQGITTFGATFGEADYPSPRRVVLAVDEVLSRLEGHPYVAAAAATSHLPLSGTRLTSSVLWEGGATEHTQDNPSLSIKVVTPGYFDILGIPLVRGRGLAPTDDERAEPVALLNRTAAQRLWPGEDPVGRWVSYVEDEEGRPIRRRVVGVVEDVRFAGPMAAADAEVYQPHAQTTEVWRWFGRSMTFVVRPAPGRTLTLSAAREVLGGVDPRIPLVGFRSLANTLDRSVATPRFNAALISLFAALALALSAVGLYGVTAFSVGRRARDIGVRMALGASAGSVVARVMGDALRTAALGGLVGLAAAVPVTGAIAGLLWSVGPRDPLTYVGTVVGLVLTGGVAALVPALRAARVDPVKTLGAE